MSRRNPEAVVQRAFVKAAQAHIAGRDDRVELLHAIPNGGKRGKVTAKLMKAEGAVAGVPDLFLPAPQRQRLYTDTGTVACPGLYLETKVDEKRPDPKKPGTWKRTITRLSKEQRWWFHRLRGQGYACAVYRDAQRGLEILRAYLDGRFFLEYDPDEADE